MAQFVLAGKANCPFYAKAELLADSLQRCLPDFRVHKVPVLPEDWEKWLEEICRRNGWIHQDSPLVWRELVDQGGKGMLLGGLRDFLQHCQDYYGITSDVQSDVTLSVASENLEAQMKLIAEEQHRISLVQPFHIWISSALSPTAHILIPHLVSSEVFPSIPTVSLHLLDLNGTQEDLQALMMETQNLALPLLHQAEFETKISEEHEKYGHLIDSRADKKVKVIVSCDSFANLKCSLLVGGAQSIDRHQFVAIATQLENAARAIIAERLKVKTSDVTDVIVWGNVSGECYVDLQRAKVFNYDGAVRGPAFFHQPVLKVEQDRKWLETDFQNMVRGRQAVVASKQRRETAMAAANGILSILKAWIGSCDPHVIFSLGVLCTGQHSLPHGIVFSVPVNFREGKWFPVCDVTLGDAVKNRLSLLHAEYRLFVSLHYTRGGGG
uniref:Lactate/malate dehydrogenase C-terminal domain-containing protein n=1 Tax=Gouania willdenowi TaxID=441366 RepID=A0A8C5HPL0_GOUWI